MRRVLAFLFCILSLSGCSANSGVNRAMLLRDRVLSAKECTFHAQITADYGDKVHIFGMRCEFDNAGNFSFTVTEPESIAGVTGRIMQDGGLLTFDEQTLVFPLLADGQITPVSAPWLFMKALRSGYIHSCSQSGEVSRITIDDSFDEEAVQTDIWVDSNDIPQQVELLWQNRRILSLSVTDFVCV